MKRNDFARIDDILHAAHEIRSYVHGMTRAQFERDRRTQRAVTQLIEIIGEASKGLSEDFREMHQRVPWRWITRMRDRLSHHHWAVDRDIIWAVAKTHVRRLQNQLERSTTGRRGKTDAQLDAEIKTALARRKRPVKG